MQRVISDPPRYRLWITRYGDWSPTRWNESPPDAVALEPVTDLLYTAHDAACFLQGFNSQTLKSATPLWAVALPVTLRYEGDATCGARVVGHVFEEGDLELGSGEWHGG